jgi:hypothetical protein
MVDKEKSWVKKDWIEKANEIDKNALLEHEKGHWIITYLRYKEFISALKQYNFTSSYKTEIDSISKHFFNKQIIINEKYDEETNHQLVEAEQKNGLIT